MFTRENSSSFPVPDVKFQEGKLDYLGQLGKIINHLEWMEFHKTINGNNITN